MSGCVPETPVCITPPSEGAGSKPGYDFSNAGGPLSMDIHFAPSGVVCDNAAGYEGATELQRVWWFICSLEQEIVLPV